MGNVNQCVFVPLQTVFGAPQTDNEDLFYDLYEDLLQGFTDEVLDKAIKRVLSDREYPGWPKPAEIVKACKSIVGPAAQPDTFKDHNWKPPSEMVRAKTVRRFNQLVEKIAENQLREKCEETEFFDRERFQDMQRRSPNKHLHMTESGLSEVSRRMTGERDD